MFIDVVTIAAFAGICVVVFLLGEMLSGGRRRSRAVGDVYADGPSADRSARPRASVFSRAMAGTIPQVARDVERIERELKRAGYYAPTALVEYLATRNALVWLVVVATGMLAVAAEPGTGTPEMFLAGGAVLAVLGYSLPRLALGWQARRRVSRIQLGLPDALDIIRMCISGGLPLRESLKRVSQEIVFFHPDIAVEFEIIRRQADADTMAHALQQFARRIDVPDINALAALVMQTDRLGTHVSTAITDYADSVRRACRQRAEERASKTSIKMLFPVVFCLAPPIYILLCGPPLLMLRTFVIEANRPGGVLDTPSYGRTLTPATDLLRRDADQD